MSLENLDSSNAVSEIYDPLTWTDEKNELMVKACREMATFHYKNSPETKALYDRAKFKPEHLKSVDDLEKIPTLGVSAMKYFLMTSRNADDAVLKLTSSGTRGQKTQIWFDDESLHRVQRMLDVYLDQEGIVSTTPCNYLIFNYDPDQAGDLGIAYTEKNQLRFAPAKDYFYAVKKNAEGQWVFLKEQALKVLETYAAEKIPVRIFGLPAFLFEFVEYLRKNEIKFNLGSESLILFGGGWKAAEDKKVTREMFRDYCEDTFGIPKERIRDAYGMAEHSAPYFECKHHRLHVPVFNRLIIRDPVTMRALPPGEQGLLELITPFNTMMPTLAILSTDWAMLDPDPCTCGWNAPTFTLIGRAGTSKHKGCAIHADDIVKRSVQ